MLSENLLLDGVIMLGVALVVLLIFFVTIAKIKAGMK